MNTVSDPKNKLVIPMPQQTQFTYRGFRDKDRKASYDMHPVSTRWSDEDRKIITKQANRLGITFSEFVRWVSFFAALEVQKQHRIKSFNLVPDPTTRAVTDYSDYE